MSLFFLLNEFFCVQIQLNLQSRTEVLKVLFFLLLVPRCLIFSKVTRYTCNFTKINNHPYAGVFETSLKKHLVLNNKRYYITCDLLFDLGPSTALQNVKNAFGGELILPKISTPPKAFLTFCNAVGGLKLEK